MIALQPKHALRPQRWRAAFLANDILKRLRGFIDKREPQRYSENLTRLIEDALSLASVRPMVRLGPT
jgi:hypothetical protein